MVSWIVSREWNISVRQPAKKHLRPARQMLLRTIGVAGTQQTASTGKPCVQLRQMRYQRLFFFCTNSPDTEVLSPVPVSKGMILKRWVSLQ